ncbi:methionine--tRNA ligase [Patescibacteria group bacterium]|nr:methionine--tRNA ligase [Patescibacteria group bacterium]
MTKYFVTTPIYYVNDKPHLGHAYTTLCADVLARWHKQKEEEVFFLTGTDEHGAKVQESAIQADLEPLVFANQNAEQFKNAWSNLNISYDYFIRTSDSNHESVVKELLQKIFDNGYIYQDKYEGLYCVGCEKFLQEDDLVNGKCPLHPNAEPIQQKETNYFFKLSAFSDKLLQALDNKDYIIVPETRKNEVVGKIIKGLQDISISRVGVSWGVAVPWDKSQTIYVWVDALINYYSATKFTHQGKGFWPANLHLMAKDILWFHAVIWPALLMAADLPLPGTIAAHGFFTIDGQKMSKSLGNVIDPNDLVKEFGVEAARYLIMAEVPFVSDGDVSLSRFRQRYQSDLANGLGNTFSRVTNMMERYFSDYKFEPYSEEIINKNLNLSLTKEKIINSINNFRFNDALDYIMTETRRIDREIEERKPWQLAKESKLLDVKLLLSNWVSILIMISGLLEPFMPETSKKIINVFKAEKIVKSEPLFPRLDKK